MSFGCGALPDLAIRRAFWMRGSSSDRSVASGLLCAFIRGYEHMACRMRGSWMIDRWISLLRTFTTGYDRGVSDAGAVQ